MGHVPARQQIKIRLIYGFCTLQVYCFSPKMINNTAKITFPILFVLFVSFLALSVYFRFAVAKPLVK